MGGVATATNKGIDALSGNPAGLSLINNSQVLLSGRSIITGQYSLDADYYEGDYIKDYSSGVGVDPKILNLGLSVPISIENFDHALVGAIGYRSFYDASFRYNSLKEYTEGKSEKDLNLGGIINTLSFGIATTISNNYSFGVSLNIPILSGFTANEIRKPSTGTKSEDQIKYDIAGGTFIQIGAIANITPELSIGASYILAHDYKLKKGKEKTENETYDLEDVKFEMPGMYSLGIAYRVKPELLVSVELQNRSWEDVQVENKDLKYVESGSSYRFGIEYGTYVLYRLGFESERLPLIDRGKEPVNINKLTGGIGFKMNYMLFDIGTGYEFTSYEELKTGGKTYDFNISKFIVYATATIPLNLRLGGKTE